MSSLCSQTVSEAIEKAILICVFSLKASFSSSTRSSELCRPSEGCSRRCNIVSALQLKSSTPLACSEVEEQTSSAPLHPGHSGHSVNSLSCRISEEGANPEHVGSLHSSSGSKKFSSSSRTGCNATYPETMMVGQTESCAKPELTLCPPRKVAKKNEVSCVPCDV